MACNDLANFEIPAHYASRLERLPRCDVATDEEILISLSEHKPVTSEKNIWAFWDAGVASMPDWCKRNVASWVRINASDGWTVRVLDNDTVSTNFALKFIPAEMLPDTFVERTMTGPWVGQHSSDLIRCAIVYLYGGIYLDVGHILFRRLDRVCWKQLEDPTSPYQVSLSWAEASSAANFFIACRKGDPFIKHWHDSYVHMWKGRTSCRGIITHRFWWTLLPRLVLLALEPARLPRKFQAYWWVVLEYAVHIICCLRLVSIQEPGPDGFNGTEYWKTKILLFDSLAESWPVENKFGFGHVQRFLDLMKVQRGGIKDDVWQEAHDLTFDLLANSTSEKVTTGKGIFASPGLGTLMNLPGNSGADIEPGTFFELLRYGAENFKQTRDTISYVEPPDPKFILRTTIL